MVCDESDTRGVTDAHAPPSRPERQPLWSPPQRAVDEDLVPDQRADRLTETSPIEAQKRQAKLKQLVTEGTSLARGLGCKLRV